MSKNLNNVHGACLCGAVKFTLSGVAESFHLCHCSRCRKATGTAHASNIFTQPENIKWGSGENNLKRFEVPDAKSFSKQFCINCGSSVPYINRAQTKLVIPAGCLNTPLSIIPDDNIFWGSRAEWYEDGRDSKKFEEYPEL